jgi:hypothetical protein
MKTLPHGIRVVLAVVAAPFVAVGWFFAWPYYLFATDRVVRRTLIGLMGGGCLVLVVVALVNGEVRLGLGVLALGETIAGAMLLIHRRLELRSHREREARRSRRSHGRAK